MAAANPQATAGLPFLVSTGIAKPDQKLRKFIRSHVMLGKNQGKKRTPGKRKRKAIAEAPSCSSPPSVNASDTSNADEAVVWTSTSPTEAIPYPFTLKIPRKLGGHLAPIRFPDAVEPGTVEVVLKFSSIAKHILFPLEPCVFFERRAEAWIMPLTIDAAFLHTMIFTTQHYFDAQASGRASPLTKVALHHFLRALKLLRERMSRDDDQVTLSDTTAAAVMALAAHALLTGDSRSAMNHVEGLHKLVNLRGGVAAFRSNAKLLVEILRCDIGISLHRGMKPVFFSDEASEKGLLPYPDLNELLTLQGCSGILVAYNAAALPDVMDGELSDAWNTMSAFCTVINTAASSRQYISMDTYLDTMASVMYRLLNMRFAYGSSSDAIRLGLLAFSCSVFLQWRTFGLSYTHLATEFKSCVFRLASSRAFSKLLVWLLMVGAVSVFDTVDDEWTRPLLVGNMANCDIDSWDNMQGLLKSMMWIGLVQDKAAKTVFNSTLAHMTGASTGRSAAVAHRM